MCVPLFVCIGLSMCVCVLHASGLGIFPRLAPSLQTNSTSLSGEMEKLLQGIQRYILHLSHV